MTKYYWTKTTVVEIEADSPEAARELAVSEIDEHAEYDKDAWLSVFEKVEPALDVIDCQNKTNEAFMRETAERKKIK